MQTTTDADDHRKGWTHPQPAELLRRIAAFLAARPGDAPDDGPDAALLATCGAVAAVATRKAGLHDGPDRVGDDAARDAALGPLDAEQRPHVERAARLVPTTWRGHAARAAAFLLLDSGALHASARHGTAHDRLLAAVVHDLAAAPDAR